MILCQLHPWGMARQLWVRFFSWIRSTPSRPVRRKFEKAELIEKYGFNRHL